MGLVVKDDGWRIPDEVWAQMEPLLPERPAHPLGCHNPRVPDRDAMNAILLVLRTGMQWKARSGRRRSVATRRGRIPPTELKRGETIAPHRGSGRPARHRTGGRESERLQ